MEFITNKKDLLSELSLVQGIVERRNPIPILANVLIEANKKTVTLTATDLDVSFSCSLSAKVAKPGALTLSAKKLYEIVKAVPEGKIHIKALENSWASIESGQSFFKIVGIGKEDFPTLAQPPEDKFISIPGNVLSELINKTNFAITSDDNRYFLNGARMELTETDFKMVATDGHRLAYASLKRTGKKKETASVVVPKKTLVELLRILGEEEETVGFAEGENHLFFRLGERLLVSKKVEDQFPAYDKVMPEGNDKTVSCETEVLTGAIRRVSLLANERSRAVRFGIEKGKIEISSQTPELGEARESVDADYEGEPLQIGFNGQYLLDFLSATACNKVSFDLRDESSQGLLRPLEEEEGEEEYRYVVMPMRL